MRRISVIVCTRNPKPDYFRRLLDSLRRQTLPFSEWELLVVDNASTERLEQVWDISWHPYSRHLREEELGLTAARLRGIGESCGQLIVYVDDDNVITADYLVNALQIEAEFPQLAVFGAGVLDPEFEVPPTAQVERLVPLLGLRRVDQAQWSNNPEDSHSVPWGAGLCVRRATAVAYAELLDRLSIRHLLDRRGQRLFSGGDDLFSWVASRNGSGFGIFPRLRILHLVRAERVRPPYLLRLVHDHAYSHAILRFAMCGAIQADLQVADTIRILLHGVRRGMFSMRSHWAAARGAAAAAKHIDAHDIQPIAGGTSPALWTPESHAKRDARSSAGQAPGSRSDARSRAVR
jgi:glycosyltransferase involved in cell wall biosynthesis